MRHRSNILCFSAGCQGLTRWRASSCTSPLTLGQKPPRSTTLVWGENSHRFVANSSCRHAHIHICTHMHTCAYIHVHTHITVTFPGDGACEHDQQILFCLRNVINLFDVAPSNPLSHPLSPPPVHWCLLTSWVHYNCNKQVQSTVSTHFTLCYSSSKIWLLSNIHAHASPGHTSATDEVLAKTCSVDDFV